MENSKTIIWISAAVLIGFSAFLYQISPVFAYTQEQQKIEAAQQVLSSQHLACTGCPLLLFDDDFFTDSKTEAKAETKQVVLEVQNMTCSL